jgi:ribonuclease BN (tRNA processing enzyme)
MEKITFLGTAGDSSVTSRQLRASGGIVVQVGDVQLHIDPGPGAIVSCKEHGINPRTTTAILVSHNHLNHANDVNAVVDAMTLGGFDKGGVVVANSTTINGGEHYTPALGSFHKTCVERILVLDAGQKAAVEDVEIHAIPTTHSDPHAIGFRILAPTFTLGYTGDTGLTKELGDALVGCDILIMNVTLPGDTKSDVHLSTESALKLVEKIKPKLALLTHFGFEMLKADPLMEARRIQIKTGVQTVAARDGLHITPSSYAAHSGQSRLTSFEEHS